MSGDYKRPEDDHEAIREIHEWLFKPSQAGIEPRANQLDGLMFLARSGKFSGRVMLWLGGAFLSLLGAWSLIKDTLTGAGQ